MRAEFDSRRLFQRHFNVVIRLFPAKKTCQTHIKKTCLSPLLMNKPAILIDAIFLTCIRINGNQKKIALQMSGCE